MAARPSATTAFLLLLVSLLAVVAHCRTLEADPATDASAESTALVEAGDETVPAEAGATEVVPAEQDGFLRLPSNRHHRHPCRHGHLHRHLWWVLRRGIFHDGHRFHHPHGEARAHLAVDAAVHGDRRGAEEVDSVAEPDPDRLVADSDGGEGELTRKPFRDGHDEEDSEVKPWKKEMMWISFHDGQEAEDAAVKPWKKEMLWRTFSHGLRHHRHHHHHEEEHEQEEEGTVSVKRFHHHDVDEEDEERKMRKPFHFHHRHHDENEEKARKPFHHADGDDSDSDDEDDEVEEMIRRFRKAIMRQRFGHGRRFHHHGRHHHAEEAEQANGESQAEEGGVVTWIKGLMNRF